MEFISDKMISMLQQEYDAIEDFRIKGGNPVGLWQAFNEKKLFAEQVMGMNILVRRGKLEWER